ncbi:MAG: HD domain-containing protein [bacterium]|nr:HD domain-containing protein [bacterium]
MIIIHSIIPFFAGILTLFIGIFVLSKGTKREVNKRFCYFAICGAIWSFRLLGGFLIPVKEYAIIWLTALSIGVIFIPITFYQFVLAVTGDYTKIKKVLRLFGYIGGLILLLLTYSGFFVKDAIKVYGGYYPVGGGLTNYFFILFFWFFFTYGTYLLYRKYRATTSPIEKNRMKFLFSGICIVIFGGVPNFLLASGVMKIYPAVYSAYLATVIYGIIIAYAIIKYHLMDIEVVIRRSTAYVIVSALMTFFFLGGMLCIERAIRKLTGIETFFICLFMAFLIAIFLVPAREWIQSWIDRIFYRRSLEREKFLERLSESISSIFSLDELFTLIVSSVKQPMGVRGVSLMLLDEKKWEYKVTFCSGINESGTRKVRIEENDGLIRYLSSEKRPLLLAELDENPSLKDQAYKIRPLFQNLQATLFVPFFRGKLIGILGLGEKSTGDLYTLEELSFLSSLGNTFSVAIEDIRLINDKAEEKVREMGNIIFTLTSAFEARDEYTFGHSSRVAMYAEKIARWLGLKEYMVEATRISAILHDIGKIHIPDNILQKPGELNDEEWEIIKRHPSNGVELMKKQPIEFPEEVYKGVRHHHERMDGTGYPDSIKGDEINIIAKIIAVVDVYEAMTSDRVYRKALSKEKVIQELRNERRYDPQVVDAFIEILEEEEKEKVEMV